MALLRLNNSCVISQKISVSEAEDQQLEKSNTSRDDLFPLSFGGNDRNSPPLKKRKLDEKVDEKEVGGDDDYNDEEIDTLEYDSDDETKENVWSKYHREIRKSQGFDIFHYPGYSYMAARFTPLDVEKSGPTLDKVIGFSKAAIEVYNRDKKKNYKLEEVERANTQLWGIGINFHITFRAKDYVADALRTFRAKVWLGAAHNDVVVKFCRLKPPTAATCHRLTVREIYSCERQKMRQFTAFLLT